MKSGLEEYLEAALQEGEQDSSGVFTLARQQALEKLAGFQLPGPHNWVLKLVQAAVASECSAITVTQNARETVFMLAGAPAWRPNQVEEAFCHPGGAREPALKHLQQALWNVGISGRRPFSVAGAGWSQALVWDGERLLRYGVEPIEETMVAVAQRGRGQKRPRAIESARHNAELLLELKERAFTCPVPLLVDGLRLDALQLCPSHGMTGRSCLLRLGFVNGDLQSLGVPRASGGGHAPSASIRKDVSELSVLPDSWPEKANLICLLAAHLAQVQEREKQVWHAVSHSSVLYWVQDGVALERLTLSPPARCCSLALIASAQDLSTDLTGMSLVKDKNYRQRLLTIYKAAAPFVAEVSVDFSSVVDPQVLSLFSRFCIRAGLMAPQPPPTALADQLALELVQLRKEWAEVVDSI